MADLNKEDKPQVVVDGKPITNKSKRGKGLKKLKSKRMLIVFLVIILVVTAAVVTKVYLLNNEKKVKPTGKALELLEAKDTDSSKDYLTEKLGEENTNVNKELKDSGLSTWDKAKLDKAYYSLVYADKIGNFTQVFATLSLIESAKKSGLNIDDNSYGIDQAMRDAIKRRAEDLAQKAQASNTGGQSE
jgi:hypothetical protein